MPLGQWPTDATEEFGELLPEWEREKVVLPDSIRLVKLGHLLNGMRKGYSRATEWKAGQEKKQPPNSYVRPELASRSSCSNDINSPIITGSSTTPSSPVRTISSEMGYGAKNSGLSGDTWMGRHPKFNPVPASWYVGGSVR